MDVGFLHSRISLNVTKRIEIQKKNQKNCPIVTVSSYFYISTCGLGLAKKTSQVSLPGLQYWDLLQWIKSNKIVSIFHWVSTLILRMTVFFCTKPLQSWYISTKKKTSGIRDQVNTSSGPSWCLPNSSRSHSLSLKVQLQAFYERNTYSRLVKVQGCVLKVCWKNLTNVMQSRNVLPDVSCLPPWIYIIGDEKTGKMWHIEKESFVIFLSLNYLQVFYPLKETQKDICP